MGMNKDVKRILAKLKRLLSKDPGPPEDPYSYVGAPKKPILPRSSASVAVEPER
jgi:hypothetical protein